MYPSVSVLIMCKEWGGHKEEQECMCVSGDVAVCG